LVFHIKRFCSLIFYTGYRLFHEEKSV
jgi:hypothetical protein